MIAMMWDLDLVSCFSSRSSSFFLSRCALLLHFLSFFLLLPLLKIGMIHNTYDALFFFAFVSLALPLMPQMYSTISFFFVSVFFQTHFHSPKWATYVLNSNKQERLNDNVVFALLLFVR